MTPRESRSLPAGSESGTSEAGTWLGLGLGLGLGSGLRWGRVRVGQGESRLGCECGGEDL